MTDQPGLNEDALRLLEENYEWLRYRCRVTNRKVEDELFSIVLEKAFNSLGSFVDTGYGMKPWLNKILYNANLDLGAKSSKENSKRQNNIVSFGGDDGEEISIFDNPIDEALQSMSAEERYMYLNDSENIEKALVQLDEPFQETIRLWLAGFGYAEIAKQLGVPTNTIGTRIHRAKRDLRPLLKDLAMEYGFSSKDKKK